VGRLDPMKDHSVFLEAAAVLANTRKETRFVCIGSGRLEYQTKLQTLAKHLGLGDRLLWLGTREDMPAVWNALDIAVSSSSYGEGLSNAIGEAMASGVPCAVTDVGDSAWIVGDTGEVVPPKDPIALRNAIERLLDKKSHTAAEIRLRVVECLSVDSLVGNTERALLTLISKSQSAKHAF
jgi:glycosyltransferase involved in cell wall biosynthesis